MIFKKGDIVTCIDDEGLAGITKGNHYEVTHIASDSHAMYINYICDDGVRGSGNTKRFVHKNSLPEELFVL